MIDFLRLLSPEILLAFMASQLLLFGVGKPERAPLIRFVAAGLLVLFGLLGFIWGLPEGEPMQGALRVDMFSHYAKLVIGLAGAAALMLSHDYFIREDLDRYEYSVLVLYAVLGMSIMVSANNLLALYIGVEMQSLALYVMAAFNRDSLRASEAGLKYFVLGALSSGLLLYGLSLTYGFTGTLDFAGLASIIQDGATPGVIAGMVFILCGLGFKISAAPFHMWTPDVYEGSPTPVTGFFASVPKFAAMALIARVVIGPFGDIFEDWQQVVAVLAVMSMFVGAIGALAQTNIKRLLAYSSIANMGYALVALSAGTVAGVTGLMIFMSIYVLTAIGVFAVVLQMRVSTGMVEDIADLEGLSQSDRGTAILLSAMMFSLAGIPPLLGFFGKVAAFYPAFEAGLWWLVVLALIASTIGAFYYLRIILLMWNAEVRNQFVTAPKTLTWMSSAVGIVAITGFLIPIFVPGLLDGTSDLIGGAAASLFVN